MIVLWVAFAVAAVVVVVLVVVRGLGLGEIVDAELDEHQAKLNTRPHADITVTRKQP